MEQILFVCRLGHLKKAVQKSSEYKKFKEESEELGNYLKKNRYMRSTSTSFVGVYNNYECMLGNKMPMPPFLTPEVGDALRSAAGRDNTFGFRTKEICSLSIGLFVKDIFNGILTYLNNPNLAPKFVLYSGHDNTLSPLINGFNIVRNEHPPMGSTLTFEIWEDTASDDKTKKYYVRAVFNNHVVRFPRCDDFCPFKEFEKQVRSLIPINYEEQCKI